MAMSLQEKYDELQNIKGRFGQAQDLVSQYVGEAPKIPSLAEQEVRKRLDFNKPLIEEQNRLREDQMTTPSRYAAELTTGRFAGNPILAGKAAAQREAAIQRRMSDIQGIRQEREGSIADIVRATTGAFEAETNRVQSRASGLRDQYDITAREYDTLYQQDQDRKREEAEAAERAMRERQLAEEQRQFNERLTEERRQFDVQLAESRKRGSGGGGGGGGSSAGTAGERTAAAKQSFLSAARGELSKPAPLGQGQYGPANPNASTFKYLDILQEYAIQFPGQIGEFVSAFPPENYLDKTEADNIRKNIFSKASVSAPDEYTEG